MQAAEQFVVAHARTTPVAGRPQSQDRGPADFGGRVGEQRGDCLQAIDFGSQGVKRLLMRYAPVEKL